MPSTKTARLTRPYSSTPFIPALWRGLAEREALAHGSLRRAEALCDLLDAKAQSVEFGEGFKIVDRAQGFTDDVLRERFFGSVGVVAGDDPARELLRLGEMAFLGQQAERRKAPSAVADLVLAGAGVGRTHTEILQKTTRTDRRDQEVVRRIRLGLARVLAGHHELGKREMHGLPDFVPWGLVLGHKPVSFRLKF